MRSSIFIAGSLFVMAASAPAATIYGVDENNNLISFNSSAPGSMLSSIAITGLDNSIGALDFRPINNVLYGLGSDRVIYTINTMSGVATAASGVLALNGTSFAFDFNPSIDRLRIVSDANDNYVFNPNDGALTNATSVFYAPGDANAGANPDVTAAAYTSAMFGGTTQLYSIDTALDGLAKQANSVGTLPSVGPLGVNLGSRTSFDIAGSEAYAFNGSTLFGVNLTTGALTNLGNTDRALFGMAISPAAVPEPTSWALMIAGFALVGTTMRRRRVALAFA